jgi:large subunit ribosomal protein L32
MGVPKRKRSRARRDKRFANKGIKAAAGTLCLNCKAPIRMHAVCASCGHYKGKKVIATKMERGMKREADRKAKALREKGASVSEPKE